MALKFKCINCSNTIVVQFLKPSDSLRCPFCDHPMAVPDDAVETEEKSTILLRAASRKKADTHSVFEDRILTSMLSSKAGIGWSDIFNVLKDCILIIRYKYVIILYLVVLLFNFVLKIITREFMKAESNNLLFIAIVIISLSLLYIYVYLLLILFVKKVKNRQGISSLEYGRKILNTFFKVLLANFIVLISVIAGMILFFIPGITLFIYFIFVNQTIVIDNAGIMGGLKKSLETVNKNFWKILFSVLLFYLVIFLLGLSTGTIRLFSYPNIYSDFNFSDVIYYLVGTYLGLLLQIFVTLLYIRITEIQKYD